MDPLRFLNFDDLYLLKYLKEGRSLTESAKALGLTQPAASQRIRKMEAAFNVRIVEKLGRNIRLSNEGINYCNKAVAVLNLMDELSDEKTAQVVNIGTRPETGRTWLWPSIKALRKKLPFVTYHVHFSSGEEILLLLGTGKLDGVLTSAPVTVRGYKSVELARETYVMVAEAAIAKRVKKFADLQEFILIEHDRSFPFQRYLSPKDRSQMQFKDVWFTGSSVTMTDAIVSGFGIGIVPEYLAAPSLETGKLQKINLARLESDSFRLIYRDDRNIEFAILELAKTMEQKGLQ